MTPGEPGPGEDRREGRKAEPLMAQPSFERRHAPSKMLYRLTVVSQEVEGLAKIAIRLNLEGGSRRGPWRRQARADQNQWLDDARPSSEDSESCSRQPAPDGADRRGPRQSFRPLEGGQGSARDLRAGKANCGGRSGDRRLLHPVRLSGRCSKGLQCLFKVRHRLPMRRARRRLGAGLPEVEQRPSPTPRPRRAWWASRSTCSSSRSAVEPFNGLHDPARGGLPSAPGAWLP